MPNAEKTITRTTLIQDLKEAQNQNNQELIRKTVINLKTNFRNPCATFLDRISKTRNLNFVLEYLWDAVMFFLPQRFKLTYNHIVLPGESSQQKNAPKVYLGRMISKKIVQKILRENNLSIFSMQVSEEVYDIKGQKLVIPFFADEIITNQNDLPHGAKLIRFNEEGIFDHCFRDASTGALVDVSTMNKELYKMHDELQGGSSVYVHCWAGKERSVVFVMCYLIKYYNFTVEQSSEYVKKYRVLARNLQRLKPEQKEFLREFSK